MASARYAADPLTLGEAMLRSIPSSVARIADTLGLQSPQSVQNWRHGVKVPGPKSQLRLAAVYGIPVNAWSSLPSDTLAPATPPELEQPSGAANDNDSALARTKTLLRETRARRPAFDAASSMDYFRSIRIEMALTRQLAQLEQDADALQDRIVRLNPYWAKIRDGLADVLSPYPDAAERVAEMLDRLDA